MSGARDRLSSTVPVHSLYGEPTARVVDFLHIERIRSRSERFDWSIDVHTHPGLCQVVFVSDGTTRVRLDAETYDLAASAVVTIPPGVVHSFAFEPGTSGYVITLADGQLDGMALGSWTRRRLFHHGVTLSLAGDDAIVDRLRALCSEMLQEHDTVDTGRVPILEAILGAILLSIARKVDNTTTPAGRRPASNLFREFRMAVEDHYTEHWQLSRYVDLLHVSESSLNRTCRAIAGATAFEILQGRLELEARRRLMYTTVPIQRLAGELGFLDPAYFSRFFKRRTGVTPNEFRRSHRPA
jgi:AraC family transcriptional regulator, transcriptional activator of pobA